MTHSTEGDSRAGDEDTSLLGLPIGDIGGISVDELIGNPVAIRMFLHRHKEFADENLRLRADVRLYERYARSYQETKRSTKIGTTLQFASGIFVAFGVNLLTSNVTMAGLAAFVAGVAGTLFGMYISLSD